MKSNSTTDLKLFCAPPGKQQTSVKKFLLCPYHVELSISCFQVIEKNDMALTEQRKSADKCRACHLWVFLSYR
jgi:hypothetical protein